MTAARLTNLISETLPRLIFIASLVLLAFGYGALGADLKMFPFEKIQSAKKTARLIYWRLTNDRPGIVMIRFSRLSREQIVANRIVPMESERLTQSVLMSGGLMQFTEYCPTNGCLAVVFSPTGEVIHAYPYRPDEIFARNKSHDFPYETISFDFADDVSPIGIATYPDGDLLVTFQTPLTFPFAAGVARITPDGNPRWFRWDYSHHWPTLVDGEHALVPGLRIGEASLSLASQDSRSAIDLACDDGRMYYDTVRELDGEGTLIREVSVFEALTRSPFAAVLQHTTDPCDPIHLNYVDVVDAELAASVGGLEVGDLIVSLRNISAFGFIDHTDGRFKRLVRGNFLKQHSVQHWRDGKFLLFDNQGADDSRGSSRLYMVDLATGVEQTVFPRPEDAAKYTPLFSATGGDIEISRDRQRAIVAFSEQGMAYEVRLADGEVLAVFNNIHDVASIETLSDRRLENAARFQIYGIRYTEDEGELP